MSGPKEIWALLARDDGGQVCVTVGNRRVGTLSQADGAVFADALAAGAEHGRPVLTQAIHLHGESGSSQIVVYQPAG